jgi:MtrB/PioB family decaheme-associated outer membrane protein
MSEKTKHTLKLTALSAALLAVYGPALAEDAALAPLTKPESTVSVGVGNWSDDRHQQGIYDGMREAGTYLLLDGSILKRDDATGTWFTINARNLGLDNREIRADWLRQGNIGGYVEYNRIPRDNPWTFNTGLQGIGTTRMTISGAGASALPIVPRDLGTKRDQFNLGFYKNFLPGLDFKVDFKNEKKDGTRNWGLGSQPFFLAEPIDSSIRQLELTFTYARERLQMSGGYYGSWYNNENPLVFGLINGQAQPGTTAAPNPTPLVEPLSNQAHQIYVNGGYDFTKTTRGTFKLSYGRAMQDDALPTYDLAAPNNRFINAPSTLDGRMDTTLAEAGLSMRPMPKLSVLANLRYHDHDDKTPVVGFVGSNVTGIPTVFNTPHSFTTKSGKVEATYRLPADFSVIGGIDYRSQDRSAPLVGTLFVPFRQQLDETTYRAQLRRILSETVNGSIAYLRSVRNGKDDVLPGDPFEDAINPMHIADRTRNKWRGVLDWAPMERMSLQFVIEDSRDKYGTDALRPYGLQDGSAQLYSLDASFELSEAWQLVAWYSRDVTKATELGQRTAGSGAADAIKQAHLEETGDSYGLGLRGKPMNKLKVGADVESYVSRTKYQQDKTLLGAGAAFPTVGGATEVPLPDIKNTLFRVKLFATYAVQKNGDVRFDVIHEQWRTDDWTWMMMPATGMTPWIYGTTTGLDGTTVTADRKQTATFVGVRYIYKFQ